MLVWKLHKKYSNAVTNQTLKQLYPLEFNKATPNAYQLIVLYLCNKLTPNLTQAPPASI